VSWGEAKIPTKRWTHWGVATSRHIATQHLDFIQAVDNRASAFRRRKIGIAGLGVDSNLLARGRTGSSRAERIIAITDSAGLFNLILPESEGCSSQNQGHGCDETKLFRVAHGIFLNKSVF
jgi:hypothetical protein